MKFKSCECTHDHSTYRFVNEHKTWMDAEQTCQRLGGNLLSQKSSHIETFKNLQSCCPTSATDQFWIGIESCRNGLFRWINEDSCVSPSSLKIFETSNASCAITISGGAFSEGQLLTGSCQIATNNNPFICEFPSIAYSSSLERGSSRRSYIFQDAYLPEVIIISLVSHRYY